MQLIVHKCNITNLILYKYGTLVSCIIYFYCTVKIDFIICLLLILTCDREVTTFLASSFQNSHLHNLSPSDMYILSCVRCLLRPLITKYLLHHYHLTRDSFSIWFHSVSLIYLLEQTYFKKWKEDWAYCKTCRMNVG